jgi:Fuc2NAc and GlcNAc transferase
MTGFHPIPITPRRACSRVAISASWASRGLFTLQASHQAPQLSWSWLILSAVFWVDATLTLLRRLSRGERVWQAHRSHAYQRAAQRLGVHRPVSVAVLAINLFWLAPWATLVAFQVLDGSIGLILAVLPLLLVVIALRGGTGEESARCRE